MKKRRIWFARFFVGYTPVTVEGFLLLSGAMIVGTGLIFLGSWLRAQGFDDRLSDFAYIGAAITFIVFLVVALMHAGTRTWRD
jgi:hypothetical protein